MSYSFAAQCQSKATPRVYHDVVLICCTMPIKGDPSCTLASTSPMLLRCVRSFPACCVSIHLSVYLQPSPVPFVYRMIGVVLEPRRVHLSPWRCLSEMFVHCTESRSGKMYNNMISFFLLLLILKMKKRRCCYYYLSSKQNLLSLSLSCCRVP